MTSIDETAHTMFGMGRMNPMTLLQTMREIKSILDIFKRKADEAADSVESSFNFTGQHTDIAAVSETGSLQANVIESIPDETVRKNTISAYTDALNVISLSVSPAFAAAPSGVDTSSYSGMVDIVFWVATIAIAAGGGIPSLIKLVQGQADEDSRGRNAGIAGLVITGAVIGAAAAIKSLLF